MGCDVTSAPQPPQPQPQPQPPQPQPQPQPPQEEGRRKKEYSAADVEMRIASRNKHFIIQPLTKQRLIQPF